MARHGKSITLFASARTLEIRDPLDAVGASASTEDDIRAPMPGLVTAVAVAAGAEVAEGDRLLVLEAMKMEHVLRAPRDGVIAEVTAAAGDQVAGGGLLIALEPAPGG